MSSKKSTHTQRDSDNVSRIEGRLGLRPSEFMRARHPELFSDSKVTAVPQLPREVFEYHLETLTHKKQEIEFEHFARRLAEKEICPNLIPQTGPTGGGDSKVDTETYPVADALSIRWYEGIGQEASQERWAFAFSAKKAWRSKVQSDVKKIVGTNRGYKRIIFITNQFVEDRARAEVVDTLANKYKVSVSIFDRNWIVKRVFEHDRLRLAAETLNIQGYDEAKTKVAGPHDIKRQSELRELEEYIDDPNRYRGVEYQLAEDCLQAALLARGLELHRVDVEGRFQRAERIAERVGHRQQKLRIAYNRVWTAYWWYEDIEELNRLYDCVEDLAISSIQATDIELLANLWQLLHTAIKLGTLSEIEGKLADRTKRIKKELDRLAGDTRRPNNAHQARTDRLIIDLTEALAKGKGVDEILVKLKDVLEKSEGLTEYPVATITEIIQELGEVLPDNKKFDDLLEVVVSITEQRASEGEAGNVLLTRGYQKLEAGKKYDAIKLLGRVQQKLAMLEYKSEWIFAAAGCGLGYEAAGLLWAARSNMLMAANQSFSEYLKNGTLLPQTLLFVQKLVWLELQLGRIPDILAWMDIAATLANNTIFDDAQREEFINERTLQARVLGILFLKTDLWNLKKLDFLPPVLEEAELFDSWMPFLYVLGYEDYLRSENVIPETETAETVLDFFYQWRNQPASSDVPDQPDLCLGDKLTLHSYVLGCEVVVDAANNLTSVYLAETILGALEAFWATSFDTETLPYRSELHIVIQPSEFISGMPEYQSDESTGGQTITIRHPVAMKKTTKEERNAFREWLQNLTIHIAFQIAVVHDMDAFVEKFIKDEGGIGRALIFSEVEIAIENILGESPKFQLSDWRPDAVVTTFPLKRSLPWDHELTEDAKKDDTKSTPVQFGEGEPPDSLFGIDHLKHKDRRVISLINVPLWNRAKWRAIAYIWDPVSVPVLMLGFYDSDTAKLIFKEWRNKLGKVDEQDQLRVSIITEIDKRKPASYRVIISTNPNLANKSKANHFIMVSRIQQMDPPDLDNLNNFRTMFNKVGRYILIPAQLTSETTPPTPIWELGIVKRELDVRPAWQIAEHDPDVPAIRENDDPIIPEGVKNAPVIHALQRFSRYKKRRRH